VHEAIARLLREHCPADAIEEQHLSAMRTLVAKGESSCVRDHFEPGHFTASAFVLSPERDSLLLIHHSKLGRWLQPGGHLEVEDADPVAAARREVFEETGLDGLTVPEGAAPLLDVDVHTIPARKNDPEHDHHDLRLLFVAPHRNAIAGDGVDAARWVRLDALHTVTQDASVQRAAKKIRRGREATG
jgi:8-oxo-dGTP pyrophosphatase MutT (NUDIX family)